MAIPIFQVDAFTEDPFKGNPAGVCLLRGPADEAWMRSVAAEMNLAETAFPLPDVDGFDAQGPDDRVGPIRRFGERRPGRKIELDPVVHANCG